MLQGRRRTLVHASVVSPRSILSLYLARALEAAGAEVDDIGTRLDPAHLRERAPGLVALDLVPAPDPHGSLVLVREALPHARIVAIAPSIEIAGELIVAGADAALSEDAPEGDLVAALVRLMEATTAGMTAEETSRGA